MGGPLDVTIPGVYDCRLTVLDGDTPPARTAMGDRRPGVGTDDTLLLGVQRAPAPPGLSGAIRNGGPLVASMPLAPNR